MVSDAVWSRLENDFVLVSQYTDDKNDNRPKENVVKYAGAEFAVPIYIIVDSEGRELERLVPPTNIANLSSKEFADFLDRGKKKFANAAK
jgi:hypothetical protein